MGEKRERSQVLDLEEQSVKRTKPNNGNLGSDIRLEKRPSPNTLDTATNTSRNSIAPTLPRITDEILYRTVFTHSSIIPAKYNERSTECYERLEWLGDAYLELIASQHLYVRFPQYLPGRLSQLRQQLVCNETLARYAELYGFHELLNAPHSVLEGRNRTKVMGDVFEAYVAAVIIDHQDTGLTTATEWMKMLWEEMLAKEQPPAAVGKLDAKTLLASRICIRDTKLKYKETQPMDFTKKGFTKAFVGVFLTGWGFTDKLIGRGVAPSKTEAGMLAATNAMEDNKVLIETLEEKKQVYETDRKRLLEENASQKN